MAYQFKGFSATKPVARLVDASGNYEAFFVLYDSNKRKHNMRYKAGINTLPAAQRPLQAKAVCDVLWQALNKGWNPLLEKYPKFEDRPRPIENLTFGAALEYAMAIKKPYLSKYSAYDYEGCVRFMKKAAQETGHLFVDISKIERKDIRMIVATAKEQRSWSNKARNKNLENLKAILSVLVEQERIPINPAHGIKTEPEEVSEGYKRLTDAEKERIAELLMQHDLPFFEYILFIYQSGIRRKELLMIKVKDVNLHRRQLTIRPEVAKTNSERIVPITDDLMEVLLRREIWSQSPEWYLFSNLQFIPGPDPFHLNTATNSWRSLVQKDLGIDCKLYSLKHKGADDKIEAGIELDVLRTLYGHRSK